MKWNVFYHNINSDRIEMMNIFQHSGFRRDVEGLLRSHGNKDEFAEQLRKDLMYYFWSRCEYELVLEPWVGGRDTAPLKIDIYTQVMLNWEQFLDYVYSHG